MNDDEITGEYFAIDKSSGKITVKSKLENDDTRVYKVIVS